MPLKKKPQIVVITGEIRQGKTTFVKNLVEELKKLNLKIAGFLAIGKDVNDIREGFDLMNIQTGETIPICTTRYFENSIQIGKYYFDPDAFLRGNDRLKNCMQERPDIIVIDEIGPLELQGKGWSHAIDYLLKECYTLHIWIIRKNHVEPVLLKWKIKNPAVFNIATDSIETVYMDVIKRIAIAGVDPIAIGL